MGSKRFERGQWVSAVRRCTAWSGMDKYRVLKGSMMQIEQDQGGPDVEVRWKGLICKMSRRNVRPATEEEIKEYLEMRRVRNGRYLVSLTVLLDLELSEDGQPVDMPEQRFKEILAENVLDYLTNTLGGRPEEVANQISRWDWIGVKKE